MKWNVVAYSGHQRAEEDYIMDPIWPIQESLEVAICNFSDMVEIEKDKQRKDTGRETYLGNVS